MAAPSQICSLCNGTGWKAVEEGGVRRVERCACQVQTDQAQRLRAARIPPRYQHCDFSNFEVNVHENSAYNESLRAARFRAEAFVREFVPSQTEVGLLFMGRSGVGKTHLAVAILRALVEKGVECLFYDFRELLKAIQDSYNPVSQATEMEVLAPVLESEVLLLDDLGASKPSLWVQETVGHILNSRYNNKRVTVITTNYLDVAEERNEDKLADRIGERMRSRLYEMCLVVEMQSEDFRRTVKQAAYHMPRR